MSFLIAIVIIPIIVGRYQLEGSAKTEHAPSTPTTGEGSVGLKEGLGFRV